LNTARLLVSSLLISSVVLGAFFLPMTQMSSGFFVTTYTTTSTSYHYWQIVTTTTRFTVVTFSTFTQKTIDGPYLRIEGNFYAYSSLFKITITNMMNVRVQKGKIVFTVSNMAGTVSDEVSVHFGEVKARLTIHVEQAVSLYHTYYSGDVRVTPNTVEIVCDGVVTQVPVATYAFTNMYTSTVEYLYTLSKVSTVSENTPILLTILLGISIGIVLLFFLLRIKKASVTPKPQPTYPSTKPVEPRKIDDQAVYAQYLEKLQELKAQGKISEKVYERLKKRYESEMRS